MLKKDSINFKMRVLCVLTSLSVALLLTFSMFTGQSAHQSTISPISTPALPQQVIPSQQFVFPGATWDYYTSPESAGYSTVGLDSVRTYVQTLATTGLVIVVDGKVLLEYGNITELSYLASVRKSVLAMLYGNYVASGKVRLNKTLKELNITDIGGLSEQEMEATITDLLSARSGVYHPASNSGDNLADAPPRGSQKHGTYYLYSNWDFNAVGTIFEQETGRNIYDALETELARPIQMQDFDRGAQRKSGDLTKSIHPAYHIYLSTRDMARIGYTMLREGNWNGKQLVPKDWMHKITSPITRSTEMNPASLRNGRFGYGYLWWVFDGPQAVGAYEGAFTGIGSGGQFITVLPKMNLVVAHKVNLTRSNNRSVSRDQYLLLLDKIIAARVNK
jgi:CubicO group peptidase (beta-lactamase class C family)